MAGRYLQNSNNEVARTRVVMADKDIKERDVLKECLPDAVILICLFHTLRSFRREISCEKMGITSGQRQLSLELVQKMAYSSTEEEYAKVHSEFQRDVPKIVKKYFEECWHPIRKEWVMGLKAESGSFLNTTNNRLESINGKLKQVISRHSSLEKFESFFTILATLRTERDHKAAVMFQKVKVQNFEQGSAESRYSELLTSYASSFVLNQLKMAPKVKKIREDGDEYRVTTSGEKLVSLENCGCMFHTSMRLPCRHMFALRSQVGEPLYDPTLCDERWTYGYYRSTQRLFAEKSSPSSSLLVTTATKSSRPLSQHEKYHKALLLSSELASVASAASNVHFERRIELLSRLTDHWRRGEEVTVTKVVDYGKYILSCYTLCIYIHLMCYNFSC